MSSRKEYRSDRSDRSSHRRESSPRRRSRRSRSASPVPQRSEKELPPSFGRSDKRDVDDNLNVLQRMSSTAGPLELLKDSIANERELKIWTRNFKEIRGICTGKLLAFDKHWNLVLEGVEEVFLKKKKAKTPFLKELKSDVVIPDLPRRVPRPKRSADAPSGDEKTAATAEAKAEDPAPAAEKEGNGKDASASEKGSAADGQKKKKKRKNRSKRSAAPSERRYTTLFVRGDNIVMIAYKD